MNSRSEIRKQQQVFWVIICEWVHPTRASVKSTYVDRKFPLRFGLTPGRFLFWKLCIRVRPIPSRRCFPRAIPDFPRNYEARRERFARSSSRFTFSQAFKRLVSESRERPRSALARHRLHPSRLRVVSVSEAPLNSFEFGNPGNSGYIIAIRYYEPID